MVSAKTLIKSNAQQGKEIKEVFEAINNQLRENNKRYYTAGQAMRPPRQQFGI